MNLDELQTAQSRERQTDSLQQLRESFYEDAGRFIAQLREERSRAAERADDPFDAPEVRRLTDDIKTAERTVEAIYERRIGKLVKQASLEAAGMAADASGLTREEQDAFETLVSTIEDNRAHVLDEVIAGEATDSSAAPDAPTGGADDASALDDGESSSSPVTDAEPESGDVDAADLMGGGDDDGTTAGPGPGSGDPGTAVPPDTPPDRDAADAPVDAGGTGQDLGDDARPEPGPDDGVHRSSGDPSTAPGATDEDGDATDDGETTPTVDRTTVRITRDVGEILGVDQRAYDLRSEDVVTLPTPNAEPLVDREAAERLD